MATTIKRGMIVLFEKCHYRVTRVTKHTVNLGPVFGNGRTVDHKRIDINQVVEDEAAWYAKWQKSETYMCM